MASFITPYGSRAVLAVARALAAKIECLLEVAAQLTQRVHTPA
jgi:hypothetical protein